MFNLGMPEIIVILVVALIVLGPKKLPEMAKSLGKGLREFRKAADDLKDSIEKDLRPEATKPAEQKKLTPPDATSPPEAGGSEPGKQDAPKAEAADAPKLP